MKKIEPFSIDSLQRLAVVGNDPAEPADQQFTPIKGEPFGKYLLVGEVAMGGMAEVFLAVQQGIQGFMKVVTLKRVLPHLSSPEIVRMFIDEARLCARFDHPNIVRTFEFGELAGRYYTVMEYLAGEDLSKVLARAYRAKEPVPFNITASIVAQVCAGLHYAHELADTSGRPMGLVHRDVNPSNIITTYNGEVKLIDFGVAKANVSAVQTLAGTIKGKIAYMSPEHVLARGVDRRSDVFSTGVVLWELLTVKPLFMRETEAATLYAIMNDPIAKPSTHRPDVPPALEAIAMRALARTPADRYETAEEMREALEAFIATQPKVDARVLARYLEGLFGQSRADAKRAISESRSLPKNISLVMRLRSEIRDDIAEQLAAEAPAITVERAGTSSGARRKAPLVAVGVVAIGALGGLGALALRHGPATVEQAAPTRAAVTGQTSVEITSEPAGAAVFIDGEPTGLKTPTTLSDVRAGTLAIRIEKPGYAASTQSFEVVAGKVVSKQFTLAPLPGRLILVGLPADGEIYVDGGERLLGEVITLPAGKHDLRLDQGGAPIVQQTIETGAGDQTWELRGGVFTRR